MRILSIRRICLLFAFTAILFSCSDKEELITEPVSSYYPLGVGKYITYRLDSLVVVPFNTSLVTRSYQEKHIVNAQITDNLGRPSYRVYRYINNADGTGEWIPNGSYMVTPLAHTIEVTDNNLRFIKLSDPISEGRSWRGNTYLPADPFVYDFSIDNAAASWDYTYDLFETEAQVKDQTYADVWTVEQIDEQENDPLLYPQAYASKIRSVEKYAKNIGLVYKQLILWEYETKTNPEPVYTGFGITMWMIDHN